MKLYYTPGACSLSPHISALEAGIALDLVKVDLKTHKTESGEDFYAINPKGYVPALRLDSGELLTEGPAILQYFADSRPGSLLPPAGEVARYQAISWLAFIGTEIHKSYAPLFGKSSDEAKAEAKEKIVKRFAYVEDQLKSDYLLGDQYSAPDGYLFVTLNWARMMKIDISHLPKLSAYFARMQARPKLQQALKEEGLA